MSIIDRFRRRVGRSPVEVYGETCPVCGSLLGWAEPQRDPGTGMYVRPPSVRLELGQRLGEYTWRVTLLAGNYRPRMSVDPPFNEYEVDWVYVLCGDGHIFPDSSVAGGAGRHQYRPTETVREWNMVAAIGALASGKTYLLVRMLHQELNNLENWHLRNDNQIRRHDLSPLESLPLEIRSRAYNDTLSHGAAISPTSAMGQGTPASILADRLPGALDDIKYLVARTVVGGERRAEEWGTGFRQPLVVRTEGRNHRMWTGIADLPGEMFADTSPGAPREANRLRAFNALIWVIDPVIAAEAAGWLTDGGLASAEYASVLEGSLRPGTIPQDGGLAALQRSRDYIQSRIGQQLIAAGGPFMEDRGERLRMLVAVTKCDLIHAALQRRRRLTDFGPPGVVLRGIAAYLASVAERWADGEQAVDAGTEQVLHLINPQLIVDPDERRARVIQVAEGLLYTYSLDSAFWNLVYTGGAQVVTLLPNRQVTVPSIGDHLDLAMRADSFDRLLLRDLIMSAIGCGISYGMGQQAAMYGLLQDRRHSLRFFLCSPLGTVPHSTDRETLSPLAANQPFPKLEERSAALTQLLLAALGKAHAHE
ncbi:hypothetical protein Daura_09965 [Dactylosporangium aurantiacum]|uniref:Uncharacterized protein n=1 Tax=Dactylosporangium aurantiacum TaxID=35754 RepID=A0A9Q9IIX6_9ACTN|nr:hypothetical protein [Dactylosporangium aurantiacum]MDG6109360.1 hypothetical protein [Dactylosporangium aurantiacum]UWZ56466.1 hypothetical protein Daura_09965 [Dactylosporangium aurantiacum]